MIGRRQFITLLGGTAAWPLAARAQQPAMPVIGYLDSTRSQPDPSAVAPFRKGLNEAGYVEGRNVAIDFRATDQYDRLPALVADLIRRQVAVLYAYGSANAAQAAEAATTTIPIVFANGGDSVALGLVASMSRPGGNATGVSFFAGELAPKRLELLRELVPQATMMAFLVNPNNARAEADTRDMRVAARGMAQQFMVFNASTADEIDTVLATVGQHRTSALLIHGDGFFLGRRHQLAILAARYAIPVSYATREYVEAGGLMSYGDDRLETLRQAGIYVGKILKGERPADLPVQQPSKFEFVINIRTAKTLGLTVPLSLLTRADEVIE
jgi:putative tryptophan/tyrosine transport system substrate-binding protein